MLLINSLELCQVKEKETKMGNIIGRSEIRSGPSGLKLESQRIVDFNGRVEDWQKWKNRTQCAFDGSGYERILSDREYANRMRNQNRVVFSQLSVATSGGTAYHLVKQHDEDKDGYAAWQSLIKWFDGDVLKAETADTVRARLESYKLGNGTTASQYINNFLTAYRELNNIPGESISDSHALSMFLHGITDPDFSTFVQIQRNKNEGLEEAVLALRKEDRVLFAKRIERKR